MIITIIPTIYRDTLERAINSVVNKETCAIIESGGTAGQNRNKGIEKARNIKAEWITFLDDDDYYLRNWTSELDYNYDIVIFRMNQGGLLIPDETDKLKFGNVGINFALNMEKIDWNDLPEFDSNGEGEDWRFLEKLLQKYNKVKITEYIYYVAEKRNYNQ